MKIDSIILKPVATEVADGGEKGQTFQKTAKHQAQPAVPDALDIAELSEIDVVTISKGLRQVGESASAAALTPAPQTTPEGLPAPTQGDVKTFNKADSKEKNPKGHNSSVVVINKTDAKDVDTVDISRELKSALKTVLLNDAGTARRIDVSHEAGVSAFLLPFLSEALPGCALKLKKVYRKKSGPVFKKKRKQKDNEEGHEPPEQESTPNNEGHRPGYYDEAGALKLLGGGIITTRDHCRLRFSLELEIKAESGLALRGERLRLPSMEINYSGPANMLTDYRFAFEAKNLDKDSPFKGRGYGLFIIDLIEVGTAVDGSPLYGIGEDNNNWTEAEF